MVFQCHANVTDAAYTADFFLGMIAIKERFAHAASFRLRLLASTARKSLFKNGERTNRHDWVSCHRCTSIDHERNAMYSSHDRLIIFDADGTTIDAFSAIEVTFARHGMEIGDLESFQKRRRLFKYLGGIREFPFNLKKQFGRQSRKKLLLTLTDVYRNEATLFPGIADLFRSLIAAPDIRVGLVTRNITNDAELTLKILFARHGVDLEGLDFVTRIPVKDDKATYFKAVRERFDINPARCYTCGDEHHDYIAAISSGMRPFIVSYGFEDHDRLIAKFDVPEEVISRGSDVVCARIRHALDLPA